ncbi:MAG: DNA polymerase III subunit epsilon [Deltaproteobacteria bacterium]|nr:DNA polymerase III subunit epsilon [Candidatus Anaeroferrophillus wilburensis]MBN2888766.1 DNA polymerase III subunit epsilon [Deltaproteobacteria bacterium]
MREIVLDTETTGISARQGHRIIEIACLELENGQPNGKVFHQRLNPGRPIDWQASRIHGIRDDHVRSCPAFSEIAPKLFDFIADSPLVIHNAPFDLAFLRQEILLAGRGEFQPRAVVDTLQMARRLFPGRKNSLEALCHRFAIDVSGRQLHGALIDCRLLARVYHCLLAFSSPS